MLAGVALAILLVAFTFLLHYRSLIWLWSRWDSGFVKEEQWLILITIFILFWVHMLEIGAYALAYYLAVSYLDVGRFMGEVIDSPMTYFYYSGVMYTSLGLGDVYPTGHIRFVTFMEALNGLMLITWSASFTYLAMRRTWH